MADTIVARIGDPGAAALLHPTTTTEAS